MNFFFLRILNIFNTHIREEKFLKKLKSDIDATLIDATLKECNGRHTKNKQRDIMFTIFLQQITGG